jgi:hypothetical protein
MAPGLTTTTAEPVLSHSAPKNIFPDGIRTSGQHAPVYEQLKPYAAFPKEITGPTVWKQEEYADTPDRWTHVFTAAEIGELGAAAERFIERGIKGTGISKVSTPCSGQRALASAESAAALKRQCRRTFRCRTWENFSTSCENDC